MLLLTERPVMERVLDYVVQGNTAQMADPAFVKELETWIRFNGSDAIRTGDGLFGVSSGNIAVFVGQAINKAHWVDVGRCYERFALQATALDIRNAFLNQPVEVPAVRSTFADAIGLGGQRPDLVVRFGRGPTMPRSLRRPVQAVLI